MVTSYFSVAEKPCECIEQVRVFKIMVMVLLKFFLLLSLELHDKACINISYTHVINSGERC